MNNGRETILRLLSEGKITIEEAEELLDAISGRKHTDAPFELLKPFKHKFDYQYKHKTDNQNQTGQDQGFNFDFHFPWDDPDWKWPWEQEGWQWPWDAHRGSQEEPSIFHVEEDSQLIVKCGDGNLSIQQGDDEENVRIDSVDDETHCELSEDRKTVYVSSDDSDLAIQVPHRIVSIQVSIDDGNVKISDLKSDVALKLDDGNASISGVNGKIQASLEDGNIVLNDIVSGEVALNVHDGSISINLNQPVSEGSFNMKAEDGRISLSLSPDSRCQITATAEDGAIRHDFQNLTAEILDEREGYLEAKLNGGGADFNLSVEDGEIVIRS